MRHCMLEKYRAVHIASPWNSPESETRRYTSTLIQVMADISILFERPGKSIKQPKPKRKMTFLKKLNSRFLTFKC